MRGAVADLNQAMVFCKIVECAGFTAAAAALGMPKTTVSKKLQDLEARLGSQLIHRTTRRLSLTEAGTCFYQHCRTALQHIDGAEGAVRALQQEPQGMLRVGAPMAMGLAELMPVMSRFMATYPRVQATILLVDEDTDPVYANLDVALRLGTPPATGHSARLVHQAQIALFVGPAYIGRRGTPVDIAQLPQHDLIGLTVLADGELITLAMRRGAEETTLTARARLLSNDAGAMMSAAQAGIGIAPLALRYALPAVARGELVPVLPAWSLRPVDVFAAYGSRRGMSLKSRVFVDFVTAWFHDLEQTDSGRAQPRRIA